MIDLDEFLERSGIELRSLEQWIEREWLLPEQPPSTGFTMIILSEVDAARARLIHDLKQDMGVNDEGVEIVLHLLDQLHGLRRALEDARTGMQASRRRNLRRLRVNKSTRLLPSRRRP